MFDKILNNNLNFKIQDAIDILLVATAIYGLLVLTRKTRASQVLKGLGIFLVLAQVCRWIGLSSMSWVLNKFIETGIIILVIIFQPEIRRALEHIGRNKMLSKLMGGGEDEDDFSETIAEIETATLDMSRHKVGALMVFENQTGLNDVIETGHIVDGKITAELIENIFFHNAPLHDGAMILNGERIVAAGCFLPLSDNRDIDSELGTRHRAAIGLSEISDARIIVVSEETGAISLAHEGTITRYLDRDELHKVLETIYNVNNSKSKRIGGMIWKKK
ncbi:MAG: diadenylate cyclase CdaA [Clostridia bacterium]|nr:diadenylate cyclase CdaA [Clostridia bacterium]